MGAVATKTNFSAVAEKRCTPAWRQLAAPPITSVERKENHMTGNKEQALFNFLNEIPLGATDPGRRAMLKKCSEQIERILAASIRAERREKDLRRKDRHSEPVLEVEQKPGLELEPKQKQKLK
jgi:hypothetical protein